MTSLDWNSAPRAAAATMPSPIFRLGKKMRHRVSAVVARSSHVGDQQLYDPALFPWIDPLEAHAQEIKAELQAILDLREAIPPLASISPDHRRIAPPGKWKSFFLKGYGYEVEDNLRRCPVTADLVSRIPGLNSADRGTRARAGARARHPHPAPPRRHQGDHDRPSRPDRAACARRLPDAGRQ